MLGEEIEGKGARSARSDASGVSPPCRHHVIIVITNFMRCVVSHKALSGTRSLLFMKAVAEEQDAEGVGPSSRSSRQRPGEDSPVTTELLTVPEGAHRGPPK